VPLVPPARLPQKYPPPLFVLIGTCPLPVFPFVRMDVDSQRKFALAFPHATGIVSPMIMLPEWRMVYGKLVTMPGMVNPNPVIALATRFVV
jgi:hypothetical protein